jgi:hypothetical protein
MINYWYNTGQILSLRYIWARVRRMKNAKGPMLVDHIWSILLVKCCWSNATGQMLV